MTELLTEEAKSKTGETEGANTALDWALNPDWLDLAWNREKDSKLSEAAAIYKTNKRLLRFLVSLSLVAMVGSVISLGLDSSFSTPWAWEW